MKDDEPTSKAGAILVTVLVVVLWTMAVLMTVWLLKLTFFD